MTAICHVLEDVAAGRYTVPTHVVAGLADALDCALELYAASSAGHAEERA